MAFGAAVARLPLMLGTILVLSTVSAFAQSAAPLPAYFIFEQQSPKRETKRFSFKLMEPSRIAEARMILATKSPKNHIQGVILKTRATYNPEWSFHLAPMTIGFFEAQIEVCDANVTYVEEHLQEVGGATLPRGFWCPWSSRLALEITNDIDPETESPRR